MRANLVLKGIIGLTFLASFTKAGDCDTLKSYLSENDAENILYECEENKQGNVTYLEFDGNVNETVIKKILSYNTVETLSYFIPEISCEGREYISLFAKLPNLKELTIGYSDCGIDYSLLKNGSFKKLTVNNFIDQKNINDIAGISSIEELDISELYNDPEDNEDFNIEILKNHKKLTTLHVNQLYNIKGLTTLKNIKKLYAIFTKEKLEKEIATMKHLEFLEITPQRDERKYNIDCLKSLKNLKSLSLVGAVFKRSGSELLGNSLASFTKLKELKIEDHYITQENLNSIFKLTNLKVLIFSYWAKGLEEDEEDLDFNGLKKLTKLTTLEFDGRLSRYSAVFNEIPKSIFSLTNLKRLVLNKQNIVTIPDKLANLRKLEYLDLSSNKLNCEIPQYLNNFPNLKYVNFDYNKEMTGKTLTNKKLETCIYDGDSSVCKAKEMSCFDEDIIIESC